MVVRKGRRYRCIRTVYMQGHKDDIRYIEGKIYKSEIEGCITDETGLKEHFLTGGVERHSKKLSPGSIIKEREMEIVELDDYRYLPLYFNHHLKGCKNYFFILATIEGYSTELLIWPGGEIKVRHAISNKRMGRVKVKPVKLVKDTIRCVIGQFGGPDNWMILKEEVDDCWSLSYDPSIDIRVMDEIMWILQRLKL